MRKIVQNTIALLARQTARRAKSDSTLSDLADDLYVFAIRIGVSKEQLPQ